MSDSHHCSKEKFTKPSITEICQVILCMSSLFKILLQFPCILPRRQSKMVVTPCPPFLKPLITPGVLSVSMNCPALSVSYNWNRVMYVWSFVSAYVTSLGAQMVKNLPAMQEIRVQPLGQEDPLEQEMTTHPSIPAWRIPWTEEPGRLQSVGTQRVRHD